MSTFPIGPDDLAEKYKIRMAYSGVGGGAGCHCGMINNIGIHGWEHLPEWSWSPGTQLPYLQNLCGVGLPPAVADRQVIADALGAWCKEHFANYRTQMDFKVLSSVLKERVFAAIVKASTYSMYMVAPVINYGTKRRVGGPRQSCLTSEFIEYIIKNRIGHFTAAPTQLNKNYVSTTAGVSLVRGGIWIPDTKYIVKHDVAEFSGPLEASKWQESHPGLLDGVVDWNKL